MLPTEAGGSNVRRTMLAYAAMILAAIGAYLAIRHFGESRSAATAPVAAAFQPAAPGVSGDVLFHVLLALAAVIVVGRLLGAVLKVFGQPPVIGEVVGGILLGPSLLGWLAPGAAAYLLPANVAPFLGVLSQVGVILYMFIVGLEFDTSLLRYRGHAALAISHASMLVPFLLAALLALGIYPDLAPEGVGFTAFSLFMGVAMSVTAFPVLARILTDLGISRTPLGAVALTCAATDDATAWCLLAFVVGVAKAQWHGALGVVALTLAYIGLMLFVVRPLLVRYGSRFLAGEANQGRVAMVFVALLVSALATELIGVHAIFGAFLLGAIIPHDSGMARDLAQRLETVVTTLLLPAFFAFTGLRTQIGLLASGEDWLLCGLIILVATAGKFGGTLVAARLTGLSWRESSSLGILMNTRGLMELVVLNIGLDLGVIAPTLFAMMVVMAVVTTLATSPILRAIERGQPQWAKASQPAG